MGPGGSGWILQAAPCPAELFSGIFFLRVRKISRAEPQKILGRTCLLPLSVPVKITAPQGSVLFQQISDAKEGGIEGTMMTFAFGTVWLDRMFVYLIHVQFKSIISSKTPKYKALPTYKPPPKYKAPPGVLEILPKYKAALAGLPQKVLSHSQTRAIFLVK